MKEKRFTKIESNKLVKKCSKIVETHHGQLFIQDLPETFVLIITLPYNLDALAKASFLDYLSIERRKKEDKMIIEMRQM